MSSHQLPSVAQSTLSVGQHHLAGLFRHWLHLETEDSRLVLFQIADSYQRSDVLSYLRHVVLPASNAKTRVLIAVSGVIFVSYYAVAHMRMHQMIFGGVKRMINGFVLKRDMTQVEHQSEILMAFAQPC